MKKITVALCVLAALALPAVAGAKPTPDQANKRDARAQCKSERGSTEATRMGFRATYRSMSQCVRQNAVEEAAEEQTARRNAAQQCKDERDEDPAAFRTEYGTNENGRNAFGKCVSRKAHEKKAEMDEEDAQETEERKNAAEECADERRELGIDAFRAEYGTNDNKRNAFGKCVSKKAQAEPEPETA